MVFVAKPFPYHPVELGARYLARLPNRIDQGMDMVSGSLELLGGDASERARRIAALVMAADIVSTDGALPEWQFVKVWPMAIDLLAVGESCLDFLAASAAMDRSLGYRLHSHSHSQCWIWMTVPPSKAERSSGGWLRSILRTSWKPGRYSTTIWYRFIEVLKANRLEYCKQYAIGVGICQSTGKTIQSPSQVS